MNKTRSRLVAIVLIAVIIGLAIWRLMNSTIVWWTILVAVLAVVAVGLFVYYMMSDKKKNDRV